MCNVYSVCVARIVWLYPLNFLEVKQKMLKLIFLIVIEE